MRSKIFIYLFVFTALILIFQLVNSGKVVSYQASMIEKQIAKRDSLQMLFSDLQDDYFTDVYFTLHRNEEASSYFEVTDIEVLEEQIREAVYAFNVSMGENPLIPYAEMEGKFLFNKVKVLNHKWIIADFSDGTYWGEVWLKYQLAQTGEISFELMDHFLYPTIN